MAKSVRLSFTGVCVLSPAYADAPQGVGPIRVVMPASPRARRASDGTTQINAQFAFVEFPLEHFVEDVSTRRYDDKYDDPSDSGTKERGIVFLHREKLTPNRPTNGDAVVFDEDGDAPTASGATISSHAGWIANWNQFAGDGNPALMSLSPESHSWSEVELPGGRISSEFRCPQENIRRASFSYGTGPVTRYYAPEAVVTLEYPDDVERFTLTSQSIDGQASMDLVFEWGDEDSFEILIGNGSAKSLVNIRTLPQNYCGHDHESSTDFEFEVLHDVVECERDAERRLPVPRFERGEIRQIPCIVSSIASPPSEEAMVAPASRGARNVASMRGRVPAPPRSAPPVLATDVVGGSRIIEFPEKISDLAEAARRMCRFTLPGSSQTVATGFLIGPDLVMTVAHLFFRPDGALISATRAANLTVEFEPLSLVAADGKVTCRLASNWTDDPQVVNDKSHRDVDRLDYAIVRLERAVGSEKSGEIERGHFRWPPDPSSLTLLKEGVFIRILQHVGDDRGVLRASFGMIKTVARKRLRVGYTASTLDASSGSAVLDQDFNLVALHVDGSDSDFPRQNQGIPLRWILKAREEAEAAQRATLNARDKERLAG